MVEKMNTLLRKKLIVRIISQEILYNLQFTILKKRGLESQNDF
jgi:hypothetical protein